MVKPENEPRKAGLSLREVRNELVVQHGAGCELVARSRAPRFAVVVVVGAEQPAHGRHPPRGGRRLVGVLPTARRDRKLLEKLAAGQEVMLKGQGDLQAEARKMSLAVEEVRLDVKEVKATVKRMDQMLRSQNEMLGTLLRGEYDCPSYFVMAPPDLRKVSKASQFFRWTNPTMWVGKPIDLRFVCAVTMQPVGEDYRITMPRDWVVKYGPALATSLRVLAMTAAVAKIAFVLCPDLSGMAEGAAQAVTHQLVPIAAIQDGLREGMQQGALLRVRRARRNGCDQPTSRMCGGSCRRSLRCLRTASAEDRSRTRRGTHRSAQPRQQPSRSARTRPLSTSVPTTPPNRCTGSHARRGRRCHRCMPPLSSTRARTTHKTADRRPSAPADLPQNTHSRCKHMPQVTNQRSCTHQRL